MSPTKKTPAKKTRAPAGARKKAAPAAKKKRAAAPRKKKPPRKLVPKAPSRPAVLAENPAAKALADKMAKLAVERKAKNVVVLDVRGIASYADYVVIASGESDRQVTTLADHLQEQLKAEDGEQAIGFEGMQTGQWVLLDYGDVVGHLFHEEARAHYDLEGLWADAPRETVR